MSQENKQLEVPELPKPDAIVVNKNGAELVIDYRKKKSGKVNKGAYVPFVDKSVSFANLLAVVGEEFAASCVRARYNSALQDWEADVIAKKGQFRLDEFIKRIELGKLVRLKISELNEQLDEITTKLEVLTQAIDANGGIDTAEGQAANASNMQEVMKLIMEQNRLNALKNAQKRAKKDDDEDDE